jgi:hypothetical protein
VCRPYCTVAGFHNPKVDAQGTGSWQVLPLACSHLLLLVQQQLLAACISLASYLLCCCELRLHINKALLQHVHLLAGMFLQEAGTENRNT